MGVLEAIWLKRAAEGRWIRSTRRSRLRPGA